MLDQIISAVCEGQTQRAPVKCMADAITGTFVPMFTLIAFLDWIIWLALGQPEFWMGDSQGGWEFWLLQFVISIFVVGCLPLWYWSGGTGSTLYWWQACSPAWHLGHPVGR